MARTSDIPLHIYQVLEEEYLSLHGPLDPRPESPAREGQPAATAARTVRLPQGSRLDPAACRPAPAGSAAAPPDAGCEWREIEAARDWLFRRGHVRQPALLAANLLPRHSDAEEVKVLVAAVPDDLEQLLPPFDWSREQLKTYVFGVIDQGVLRELLEFHARDADAEVPAPLLDRLEAELNKLLADADLYHPDRVSDAWLSTAGRGLIDLRGQLPGGRFRYAEDLTHLNRVLLEDAFPEIERIFDIRFAAVCEKMHEARQGALCLSGGGIRSGTFALGLLQGMARHNLLKEFDYLSTVSGGGYIGGWLTAWLHRHPEGLEGVTRDLANCPPARKIDPESAPLLHLRKFSNFLTPKVGLLTADTWAFAGMYLRNLLINWMVFIPLLLAVLLLPRLLLALTLAQPVVEMRGQAGLVAAVNDFAYWYGRYVLLALGFALGAWALAYIDFNRPGLREQLRQHSPFWRERSDQGGFIKWCLVPLLISAALLTIYFAWSSERREVAKDFLPMLVFGAAFVIASAVISSVVLSRHRSLARAEPAAHTSRQTRGKLLVWTFLLLAGVLAILLLWALTRGGLGIPVTGYGYEEAERLYTSGGWLAWTTELYVCLAVPAFLVVFWGATTFFVGVSSALTVVSDDDREWWARLGAWLLIAALAWVGAAALIIYGPIVLLESPRLAAAAGGLSGLAALMLGRSSRTAANREDEAKAGKGATLIGKLLPLLAFLFLVAFLAALSLGTTYLVKGATSAIASLPIASAEARIAAERSKAQADGRPPAAEIIAGQEASIRWWIDAREWLTMAPTYGDYARYLSPPTHPWDEYDAANRAKLVHLNVLHHTSLWFLFGLFVALAAVGRVFSRLVNLNIFSLHGGYRNRLIRAFLGASRPAGERRPNPFTGFDPADNLHMHELRPGLLDESDFPDPDRLSDALSDDTHPLSRHLAARKLTGGVADSRSGGGRGDVGALRADLNRVLAEESLYEDFAAQYLQSPRARAVTQRILSSYPEATLRKDLLRTDYNILLNRLVLEQAYPGLVKPAAYPPPPYKMMHVVNTTLNLVGGDNLAWQQRKAEPFSVSPLHCGCFRLGYRESRNYGGRATGGISIGTATAVSGAAASSNMGYYTTSPVMSLLLTLFNVRLGWWLGNPGAHGSRTYQDPAPRDSVMPVVSEALGMTDDRNEYVYLTDGGHFENLALYEMVLRRCRVIVCSDGAQDEDYNFGDLGNAVRKIRIDLGIPIEFTSVPIYAARPPREEGRGFYFAVGKIRYSCADWGAPDGVLLYVKPAVYGTEPRDVLEYKKSFPAFPHQSTGDQFFDEPQFESYRMLGSHVMDSICGEDMRDLDLRQLVDRAFGLLTEAGDDFAAADPKLADWLGDWLVEYDGASSPP